MNKSSTPEHLGAAEKYEGLEALAADAEQSMRLRVIAGRHARGDLEAEDLVQEAFIRILDGDGRAWPRDLPALPFVAGVIRSVASEIREKRKRRKPHMTMTEEPPDDTVACPAPTAAETLEMLQQDAAMRARALKHFEDDPELQTLTEALLQGWEKAELLSLFDHDETRYQATRKRFRRRTKKLPAALPQTGGPHDQDHAWEADDR